ncbi:MAG: serine/threonine-protein kinase, partial [Myxococcota bacterium]
MGVEQVGGVQFGRYEVVRAIGVGGMAQVYLCVRRGAGGFEKRIVLKILHSKYFGDPAFVQMFLDEARLLARLHHPNIVDVFEVECVDGVPYLAMEHVDGPTLGQLHRTAVKSGQYELGPMLELVRQVCEALSYAHELMIDGVRANLVHRDVSSENIVVDAATGVAKLIDFGIAKVDDMAQTQVGILKGKIHYMAPEVLAGERPDARADLYSVGVLLYRLTVGRLPFREADLVHRRSRQPVVSPSESPGLPEGLDAKIVEDHCKEVNRRYGVYRDTWVKEASPFIQALKPAGLPTTVVYPFGGGDLISALTTYPEAKEITTMSLEHAGDPRRIKGITAKQLKASLQMIRATSSGLLVANDSKTENLMKGQRGEIPGQLSFFLMALAV